MSAGIFLKVLSDCCLFFAILTAFPVVFTVHHSLFLPSLICAGAAAIAVFLLQKQWTVPSRLCAAIPFSALLICADLPSALVLAPAILYTVWIIFRGQLWLEYYIFRASFIKSLKMLGIMLIIVCFLAFATNPLGEREVPLISIGSLIRYGLLHLVFGVILQRELRLGMDRHSHGSIGQIAVMLGGTGAAAAGFFVAEPMLRESIATLGRNLFTIVAVPFAYFLKLILKLNDEMKNSEEYQEYLEEAAERNPPMADDYGNLMSELLEEAPTTEEQYIWWIPFVILAVIGAIFAVYVTNGHRSVSLPSMPSFSKVSEEPKKKSAPRLSPRSRVRQAYRDFLKQEKKRGTKLRKNCTTADILQGLSEGSDHVSAAELRELYLHARYDETREVSRSEADAARAAARQIHGR